MTRQHWAALELALAMAIVGSMFVAGRVVTAHFPVGLASAGRFALAAAVFFLLIRATGRGRARPQRRDLRLLFLLSLTGVVGFSVLSLFGLKYTTAAQSGIISGTTPAVVALLSVVALGERPRAATGVAVVLSVAGTVALTLSGGGAGDGANPALGNLLIAGAVLCEATFSILGKPLAGRLGAVATSAYVILFGLVLSVPWALWDLRAFEIAEPPGRAWLTLLYYAVAPTILAYLLWYDGLAHLPASTAGIFTGVMPVSAVVLGAAILDEPIGWPHLAGMLCVVVALALVVAPGWGGERPTSTGRTA